MAKIRRSDRQPDSLNSRLTALALLWLFWLPASLQADIVPEAASLRHSVKTAQSTGAMAVTANPYASDAAAQILANGGSAVDAAIAAQLVLGLTEPQSSGIGGGAFMLHWQQGSKTLLSYDGRETAPATITADHFLLANGQPMPFFDAVVGGLAVGVPGVLHMLDTAHQQHGKLPWRALFQPAITLATNGFIVSERLHSLLQQAASHPPTMQQTAFVDYFFRDGKPIAAGTLLKNPAYASTLKQLAENGIAAFYNGPIGDQVVNAVQHNSVRKGLLQKSDLQHYRSQQQAALCKTIRQYRLCGAPPPSSGPLAVMQMIAMLTDLPDWQTLDYQSADFYHRFAEALKLAMADRNRYVADPAFFPVPVRQLLQDDYLRQRARLIPLNNSSKPSTQAGQLAGFLQLHSGIETEQPSTSHLSIVDADGNIVSMTTSIEMAFGSRILVAGFLLNNQLTDFSFLPKEDSRVIANSVAPGKRPRSSMAPMIVFDAQQQPVLAIGSPGGSRIISYVAKTLMQYLYSNATLTQAVDSPHISVFKDVELEKTAAAQTLESALQQRGHKVTTIDQTSGLHIIQFDGKNRTGVADSRREGTIQTYARQQALE